MSIDLTIQLDQDFAAEDLRAGAEETLRQLLAGSDCPPVLMYLVHGPGQREPVTDHVLGPGEAMYVLTYEASDDQVAVLHTHDHGKEHEPDYALTFSVGATRSAAEYILGLAGALYAARRFARRIESGFAIWSDDDDLDPDALLEEVRLRSRYHSFAEACAALVGPRLD